MLCREMLKKCSVGSRAEFVDKLEQCSPHASAFPVFWLGQPQVYLLEAAGIRERAVVGYLREERGRFTCDGPVAWGREMTSPPSGGSLVGPFLGQPSCTST